MDWVEVRSCCLLVLFSLGGLVAFDGSAPSSAAAPPDSGRSGPMDRDAGSAPFALASAELDVTVTVDPTALPRVRVARLK